MGWVNGFSQSVALRVNGEVESSVLGEIVNKNGFTLRMSRKSSPETCKARDSRTGSLNFGSAIKGLKRRKKLLLCVFNLRLAQKQTQKTRQLKNYGRVRWRRELTLGDDFRGCKHSHRAAKPVHIAELFWVHGMREIIPIGGPSGSCVVVPPPLFVDQWRSLDIVRSA